MRRARVAHSEITARRLRRRRATIGTTVQQQTNTPRSQRRRSSRTGGRASVPSLLATNLCNHSATMMGDVAVSQLLNRPSLAGKRSSQATAARNRSASNSVVSVCRRTGPASRSRTRQSGSRRITRGRRSFPERCPSQVRPVKRTRARSTSSRVTQGRSKRPRLAGSRSASDTGNHSSEKCSKAGSALITSSTAPSSSLDGTTACQSGGRGSLEWNNTTLEVSQNQCCSALLSQPEIAPFRFTIKEKRRSNLLLSTHSDDVDESSDVGLVKRNALSTRLPVSTSSVPTFESVETASSSMPFNQDISTPSWPNQEEVEQLAPTRSCHGGLDLLNSDSDEDDEVEIDLYADDDVNDENNDSSDNINDNANNSNTAGALYQQEAEDNGNLSSLPSYSTQEEDSVS